MKYHEYDLKFDVINYIEQTIDEMNIYIPNIHKWAIKAEVIIYCLTYIDQEQDRITPALISCIIDKVIKKYKEV